jgi:hypothetical protein
MPARRKIVRLAASLATLSLGAFLVLFGIWGALALHYRAPFAEMPRAGLSAAFFVVAGLAALATVRRSARLFLPALVCFPAILFWWTSIEPSHSRAWTGDVARMVTADVRGDTLVLSNVRDFRWLDEATFDASWETRSYDLAKLSSVDLFASHWDGENIAHMLVSFGFTDGEHLVWSAELRRVEGQVYETVASMFKLSELIMVAADERDLVGVRARNRGEDVRLYPLSLPPEAARKLLLAYAQAANGLAAQPRWYNVLTNNCTTVILDLARTLDPGASYDWRVFLPGYFPQYAWDHGALDRNVPFDEWRARAGISARAQTAEMWDGRTFSRQIRDGNKAR